MYWTDTFGWIELKMTKEQASSVSHSGDCEADAITLIQLPKIKKQLDKIDKDVLIKVLREYGVWDDEQLKDHEQNLMRLIWIAGCDIMENLN